MRLEALFHRLTSHVRPALLALLCTLLALPSVVSADKWLDQLQNDMALAPGRQSAEGLLFPALIGMDPFPILSGNPEQFAEAETYIFLPRGNAQRQRIIEWVQRPAQQLVLEAVRTISESTGDYMFSLQIGKDKVPSEWVEAGFYIAKGEEDGLSLVGGSLNYLSDVRHRFNAVSYANGIARAEEGEGDEALLDYTHFLNVYRMMIDRPLALEKLTAIALTADAATKMRDLVFQYTREGDSVFTSTGITDALIETDERLLGYQRMQLPIAETYVAQQAFDYASAGGDRIDPDRFARMMILFGEDTEGLHAFGYAAAYREIGMLQGDRLQFEQVLNDVIADATRRWNYTDLHDPFLKNDAMADRVNQVRQVIIDRTLLDYLRNFENVRLGLLTEMSGTRSSLGAVAFYLENGNLPGQLVSIQPRFVRSLATNLDYLSYNERIEQSEPLKYWVPIRDEQFGPRETPSPYLIRIAFDDDGSLGSSRGLQAASRERDLPLVDVFVPGIGAERLDNLNAALTDGGLGMLATSRGSQFASDFVGQGSIPQFGLSAQDHAAFEQYLAGESAMFDFAALREVLKELVRENAPSEMDAQQLSVGLAALQVQGITPENAGQSVREQIRAGLDLLGSGAIDPEMIGTGMDFLAFGDDLSEMVPQYTGKSVDEVIDIVANMVERVMSVPSVRSAIAGANQGEFLSVSGVLTMADDVIDAVVTQETLGPIRDMLVTLKSSEEAQLVTEMFGSEAGTQSVVFALSDDNFLLYSVGRDNEDDRAALIDSGGVRGDMLFWPPAMSLYREYRNR
jgi:hypothetical protein